MESLSSDYDSVEEHIADEELAEQAATEQQSTTPTDIALVQSTRRSPDETNGCDHSSKESSLDSTAFLTNTEQSHFIYCNYLATGTMIDDGPIDFSFRNQNQHSSLTSILSSGSSINGIPSESQNEPLDLSVPHRRKNVENCPRELKFMRVETTSPKSSSTRKISPPGVVTWNGKISSLESSKTPEDSSTASYSPIPKPFVNFQHTSAAQSQLLNPTVVSSNMASALQKINALCHTVTKPQGYRTGSRQNPWQNHWINKSEEQAKDVFTCVWCKESFKSLAEMTIHMQKSPKCGMAGMRSSLPSTSSSISVSSDEIPSVSKCSTSNIGSNLLIKESMVVPRRLVRGQDVWLGKGAEQTRQILKCMWCGQSFKTLADMTNHMRVTQHYNNIISQEQIVSWKVPADKMTSQSHLNAVLTCKVCSQVFGSLKELSCHMMKNAHYKEHIIRSISENGGRCKQTRERRKKSLPVKKLLELERLETNKLIALKEGNEPSVSKNENVSGKITCEECAEKVDAKDFVTHIKNCTQNSKSQHLLKNSLLSETSGDQLRKESKLKASVNTVNDEIANNSERSRVTKSPLSKNSENDVSKKQVRGNVLCERINEGSESTSVLNAIEKLIEKSFENRSKISGNGSTGILQRLGIDEEINSPWHSPGKGGNDSKSGISSSPSGVLGKKSIDIKNGSPRLPDVSDNNVLNNKIQKDSSSDNKHKEHSSTQSVRSETSVGSNFINTSSPGQSLSLLPDSFHKVDEKDSHDYCSPRGQGKESPLGSVRSKSPVSDHAEDSLDVSSEIDQANGESSEIGEEMCDVNHSLSQTNVFKRLQEAASPCDTFQDKGKSSPSSLSNSSKLSSTDLNHELDKNHLQISENVDIPFTGHPLRELQKLLDKTDVSASCSGVQTQPGSILAFSWACNDATKSDSLMKCAFCDTHFLTKGAYRHHLSKIHFVKDPNIPEASFCEASSPSGGKILNEPYLVTKESPPPSGIPAEESPHSKFLKYTKLAKELSNKYV
ncbi:protein tiptop-like [Limulus polyphemus]|uniref:Protein tiptop-like n=1 Tax=Limulus polyphemus TaxID=6850 RepID=A0ABM1TKA0_LIMPO|nr:protein tiptop-like [Limulus polyphemus]